MENLLASSFDPSFLVLIFFGGAAFAFLVVVFSPRKGNSRSNIGLYAVFVTIKVVVLLGILIFAFCNYRIITFGRGSSVTAISQNGSYDLTLPETLSIDKIEYYRQTIPSGDYTYKVYFETSEAGYLLDATDSDITAIELLDSSGAIEADEITIVPFYVDIILGILVLIIPFGIKRKNGTAAATE